MKKKRTAKQTAATKRLVALNKKRTGKKVAKKRVTKKRIVKRKKVARKKVAIGAPSKATGKPPTKRLVRRRVKNTRPGYFPNPVRKITSVVIVAISSLTDRGIKFFTGAKLSTNKNDAARYINSRTAKSVANALKKSVPRSVKIVGTVPVTYSKQAIIELVKK